MTEKSADDTPFPAPTRRQSINTQRKTKMNVGCSRTSMPLMRVTVQDLIINGA